MWGPSLPGDHRLPWQQSAGNKKRQALVINNYFLSIERETRMDREKGRRMKVRREEGKGWRKREFTSDVSTIILSKSIVTWF